MMGRDWIKKGTVPFFLGGAAALALAGCDSGGEAPAANPAAPAAPIPAPAAAQPAANVLTSTGFANIRAGMTTAEVEALGREVMIVQPPLDEGSTCAYARIEGPAGVLAMLDGDRIVRFDVMEPDDETAVTPWRTAEGAGIGTTEDELRRLYGDRLTIEPHKYTGPQGHYAIVHAESDPHGIIFETDGTRVLNWRVGQWEEVQWVEGCA